MSKVIVIGDSCTDIFKYGDIDRICPEAPVPIIKTTHEVKNGGMSKNVVSNLEAMGVDVVHIITNPNEQIWNMLGSEVFTSYAILDHTMTVRYILLKIYRVYFIILTVIIVLRKL